MLCELSLTQLALGTIATATLLAGLAGVVVLVSIHAEESRNLATGARLVLFESTNSNGPVNLMDIFFGMLLVGVFGALAAVLGCLGAAKKRPGLLMAYGVTSIFLGIFLLTASSTLAMVGNDLVGPTDRLASEMCHPHTYALLESRLNCRANAGDGRADAPSLLVAPSRRLRAAQAATETVVVEKSDSDSTGSTDDSADAQAESRRRLEVCEASCEELAHRLRTGVAEPCVLLRDACAAGEFESAGAGNCLIGGGSEVSPRPAPQWKPADDEAEAEATPEACRARCDSHGHGCAGYVVAGAGGCELVGAERTLGRPANDSAREIDVSGRPGEHHEGLLLSSGAVGRECFARTGSLPVARLRWFCAESAMLGGVMGATLLLSAALTLFLAHGLRTRTQGRRGALARCCRALLRCCGWGAAPERNDEGNDEEAVQLRTAVE